MEEQVNKKEANKVLYISIGVILLIVVGLLTNGFGLFSGNSGGNTGNGNIQLSVGNSPVLGSPSAPVTIYEFSDFSCPFCAAADGSNAIYISQLKSRDSNWQAPLPAIISQYVSTGKAKLVFKYYPGHGTGQAAHLVGWNLNDQGLFWQFHDLAFKNQEDTGDMEKMMALAEEIGANMTKLQEGIESGRYQLQFTSDQQMGQSNGVSGTPTFFVNGEKIEGAVSFSEFKEVIDSKL